VAEAIEAKLIVIATQSGNTASVESQSRSRIPTLGVSQSQETLRRMNLLWGIKPLRSKHLDGTPAFIDEVCQWGRQQGNLQSGDRVVFVTGRGVFDNASNLVVVHTVT
jgi:pyruvate kinase